MDIRHIQVADLDGPKDINGTMHLGSLNQFECLNWLRGSLLYCQCICCSEMSDMNNAPNRRTNLH